MLQVLKSEEDDTELQTNVRALAHEDFDTDDDKEFILQEVKNVVLSTGKIRQQGKTAYQVKSLRVW